MPSSSESRRRFGRSRSLTRCHGGLITAVVVAVLILSPWLWSTGFLLHYDLVFVPHLPLSAGTLGLDGDVPRAVPNDVVVALLSTVLPGWFVERLVLVGFFLLVGAGVDRWRRPAVTTVVSAVVLTWNPWVAERLGIGHWGYLWGYAALVWVVVGCLQLRGAEGDHRQAWTTIGVGVLVGSLSGSTGALLAGVAATVLLCWPGPGRISPGTWARGVVLWLALNAAWWFPFLALAPSGTADAHGVAAFAARADSPAGLLPSLLSGGGIWHGASWPAARRSAVLVWIVALVMVAGLVASWRVAARGARGGLVALAVGGLVLAGFGSVPGLRTVLTHVVLDVPGGGLLRDGQKFVAWWFVSAGLGVGSACETVRRRASGTLLAPVVVLAGVIAPVATLPNPAFADHGRWARASYPREVTEVARDLDGRASGGVAVFPWQLYRRYGWNDGQVVLDPWQRLLSRRVLVDDDLPLEHGAVRGESPDARAVTERLRTGRGVVELLRSRGVRYVIEEKDQPPGAGRAPDAGTIIHDGPLLRVRDLGEAVPSRRMPRWAPLGLVVSGAATMITTVGLLRRQPRASRRPAAR